MPLTITIPGNPATKKTSQRLIVNRATGKPMIIPSPAYKDYHEFCVGTRTRWGYLAKWGNVHFTGPVHLQVKYWLKDNRPKDLLNLLAATADILEAAGIIDNDRNVVSVDGSRIMGKDALNPRAEIEIEAMED